MSWYSTEVATIVVIGRPSFERSTVLRTPAAAGIAAKLREEFRRPDHVSAMVVEALMLELFAASVRHRESDRAPSWLREVRRTLERDFREAIGLDALAASVNIHPTHLSRAFRRHYGLTIGEFLRDLRDAGCKAFNLVLGPDDDAQHRDHLHFDMGRWDNCK